MGRLSKIHPDLLVKAKKWREDGYTYRSLIAMTGLSLGQLRYHLVPGRKEKRRIILMKSYMRNRDSRRKKMNDYINERRWKNERLREKYGLRGKTPRARALMKPIPPPPPEKVKPVPKFILKKHD